MLLSCKKKKRAGISNGKEKQDILWIEKNNNAFPGLFGM